MREENNTLKTVAGLGILSGVMFLGYKYYNRKAEEETIKAQQNIVKSDAINSAKTLTPTLDQVKEILQKNPSAKTYSNAEYQNFASTLYDNFKSGNLAGLITTFNKMKTNADLMLLSIYYGVKVFKTDEWYDRYKVNVYNLSESINNLTNNDFKKHLTRLFNAKKITYNLF